MRHTMAFLLLISGLMLLISGCGNKGPLYLPQEPVEQTEQSPSDQPAD